MVVSTMEASSSLYLAPFLLTVGSRPQQTKSTARFISPGRVCNRSMISNHRRFRTPTALGELTDTVAETGKAEITWQIIVGTIAGITPFVVAGVEFSKRIIAQKRCEECGGAGLVLIEKEYIRCPECGGFLPWQSWRRFFTG